MGGQLSFAGYVCCGYFQAVSNRRLNPATGFGAVVQLPSTNETVLKIGYTVNTFNRFGTPILPSLPPSLHTMFNRLRIKRTLIANFISLRARYSCSSTFCPAASTTPRIPPILPLPQKTGTKQCSPSQREPYVLTYSSTPRQMHLYRPREVLREIRQQDTNEKEYIDHQTRFQPNMI